ncbi:hypothetical protein BACEGG_03609 [Bacteroides eggerthii DSM 20697]|nr:hypothetical protein BACEGG_03609 [Bacteroides eggerthii DSM 20697]
MLSRYGYRLKRCFFFGQYYNPAGQKQYQKILITNIDGRY